MKALFLSDIHGHIDIIKNAPECDVIFIAGDIIPNYGPYYNDYFSLKAWLYEELNVILKNKSSKIISIGGNHDIFAEKDPLLYKGLSWKYLQDESCILDNGMKVYGMPWMEMFCQGHAFNADDLTMKEKCDKIDSDTDILLCHCPPLGVGDKIMKKHFGSENIKNRIEELSKNKLKLVICGHMHSGRGKYNKFGVKIFNAACVDNNYEKISDSKIYNFIGDLNVCNGTL